MQLIAYLYGIMSDRRLCEEVQVNLAYRWFCGLSLTDTVTDHSSMTRIRDRLGDIVYQNVCDKIIEQCLAEGFVEGRRLISDATVFEADASMDSMKERQPDDPIRAEL